MAAADTVAGPGYRIIRVRSDGLLPRCAVYIAGFDPVSALRQPGRLCDLGVFLANCAYRIYFLNPLSGLLEGFRWSLLGRGTLDARSMGYAALVSVGIFIGGAFAFKRMERKFADVI